MALGEKNWICIQANIKTRLPLDTPTFMAAHARYFAAIDELRTNGSKIFWHDEAWCNQNEERHFVWTDRTTGITGVPERMGLPVFC